MTPGQLAQCIRKTCPRREAHGAGRDHDNAVLRMLSSSAPSMVVGFWERFARNLDFERLSACAPATSSGFWLAHVSRGWCRNEIIGRTPSPSSKDHSSSQSYLRIFVMIAGGGSGDSVPFTYCDICRSRSTSARASDTSYSGIGRRFPARQPPIPRRVPSRTNASAKVTTPPAEYREWVT